ncbi:hypothetical protein WR25_10718 [Diploscapter pachys]|uniref:Uncharacterized protein n=1 Tax=Diploscapter pachys TaxID=2018661 RepID=A0A2A2KYN8_9BILA|nr:hypothetical protein WR25_10718 [Diploscapter pachys]
MEVEIGGAETSSGCQNGNGADQTDATITLESNPNSNQSTANQTADLIELYKQCANRQSLCESRDSQDSQGDSFNSTPLQIDDEEARNMEGEIQEISPDEEMKLLGPMSEHNSEEPGNSADQEPEQPTLEEIEKEFGKTQIDPDKLKAMRAVARKMLNLKIHSNVQQYVRKIDEQQRHIQNLEAQLKSQQDQLDELSRYARNVARDRSMFEQPLPNINHPSIKSIIEREVTRRVEQKFRHLVGMPGAQELLKSILEKRNGNQQAQTSRASSSNHVNNARNNYHQPSALPPRKQVRPASVGQPLNGVHTPSPSKSTQIATRDDNLKQFHNVMLQSGFFESQSINGNRVALSMKLIPIESLNLVSQPEQVWGTLFSYPNSLFRTPQVEKVESTSVYSLNINTTISDFIAGYKLHAEVKYKPDRFIHSRKFPKIRLCFVMESALRAQDEYKESWWTSNAFPLSDKGKIVFSVQFKNTETVKQKMSIYERIAFFGLIEMHHPNPNSRKRYVTNIAVFSLIANSQNAVSNSTSTDALSSLRASPSVASTSSARTPNSSVRTSASVSSTKLSNLANQTKSHYLPAREPTDYMPPSSESSRGSQNPSRKRASAPSGDVDMVTLESDDDDDIIVESNVKLHQSNRASAPTNGIHKTPISNPRRSDASARANANSGPQSNLSYAPVVIDDLVSVPAAGIKFQG